MIKLIQGDCLEVMRGMADKNIDCVITDPPYGIDYQSAWRTDKAEWKPKIDNDKAPFVEWILRAFELLKQGGRLVCFYRWDVQDEFLDAMIASGFSVKSQIVWDKVSHGMGDLGGAYAPQHENIIYATKGRYQFKGNRPKSIIQEMRVAPENLLHPNEKPAGLMGKIINDLTAEGEIIFDPFMGSGTTGIAAMRLDRSFIGIELNPEYFKMACNRIKNDSPLFGQEIEVL